MGEVHLTPREFLWEGIPSNVIFAPPWQDWDRMVLEQ